MGEQLSDSSTTNPVRASEPVQKLIPARPGKAASNGSMPAKGREIRGGFWGAGQPG